MPEKKAKVIFVAALAAITAVGLASAQSPPIPLQGHTKAVTSVAWAADGSTVATAGDDRSIGVWDAATGRKITFLREIAREGYGGPVVAFTADLKVAAINYWGQITIRNIADETVLLEIDPILDRGQRSAFRPDVFAMSYSPDGKRLATAGSVAAVGGPHGLPGGIVIVWNTETGKIVHKSDTLSTAASSVAWSSNGQRFAAGTNGAGGELPEPGELIVWDAKTGKVVHKFKVKPAVEPGEWASAGDVVFSPSADRIAVPVTAGSRGTPAGLLINDTGTSVRLWGLETGTASQPIKGVPGSVTRVLFSPNGRQLATAGSDEVLRIWSLDTGKEVATLPAPARITALAFSPDGKSLAIGSHDGMVHIRAVPQGE